jgi:hypothetical protein
MKVIGDLQSVLLGLWATDVWWMDMQQMLWLYALMMQMCPFALQFEPLVSMVISPV